MKLMRLRYAGVCSGCGADLPARTQAWWDARAKQVTCTACQPVAELPSPAETRSAPAAEASTDDAVDLVEPAGLDEFERGVPGASARAERHRRSQKREEVVRGNHPRIGGFLLAAFDDPTSTKVWDQGAVGEELVGAWLEQARTKGIEVLHDRAIPQSKANIDHLVIAPNGVWVVDAKRYLNGKLERRDVGGFFRTDLRLFVGGRDKTTLVQGVQKQMDIVETFLRGTDFPEVPVHGALCFVNIQKGWFTKPFRITGVSVTWRKHLVDPMLAPAVLDADGRTALTRLLATHFKDK